MLGFHKRPEAPHHMAVAQSPIQAANGLMRCFGKFMLGSVVNTIGGRRMNNVRLAGVHNRNDQEVWSIGATVGYEGGMEGIRISHHAALSDVTR